MTCDSLFVDYGLVFTPGLVINEKRASFGHIVAGGQIKAWLTEALATPA